MTKYTMVMRCGDPKADPNKVMYTLVGADYSIVRIMGAKLASHLSKGDIEVTNLGVQEGKIVSTNGAMSNYTLIDLNGNLVGKPKAVVINRIETEKGLIGYTVYNTSGVLAEMPVSAVAALAKAGELSNGKIRHTQGGDIVASIGGNYPLVIHRINSKKVESVIYVDVYFAGQALCKSGKVEYAGIGINSDSVETISTIFSKISAGNEKLIAEVEKKTGINESESFGIKRTGTAGFYGVYPLELVKEIVDKARTIKFPMERVIIACTDYTDDKTEANVSLDRKFAVVDYNVGNDKTNKEIKEFTNIIIKMLPREKVVE